MINKKKDNLADGLARFINVKELPKPISKEMKNTDYYKIQQKKKLDITKRVLFPYRNNDTLKKLGKKTFYSQEKYLRNSTNGNYSSLIEKTPQYFPIKGKKRINKSEEGGNKPDIDLFFRGEVGKREGEGNTGRVFGVQRKRKIKINNEESTEMLGMKNKGGRKHFLIVDKIGISNK